MKTFVLDGNRFSDIAGFYRELNHLFMEGESWQLGESLDAFDDLLYGGFGALAGQEEMVLRWRHFEKSRADLGLDATRNYYRNKLANPQQYNTALAGQQLKALEAGGGQTYFDILLEIIAAHPNVRLVPEA